MKLLKVFALCAIAFACRQTKAENSVIKIEKPTIVGEWKHIFNPNDTRFKEDTTWYTNDHCFAKGPNGKWHAYGIIGHKPIDPWKGENKFFHISANVFNQKRWEDHDYALKILEGKERVLWAPHIIKDAGKWHMFYNSGNLQKNAHTYASWGSLCRAESTNMFDWEREPLNPLFSDPGHARDSYVFKDNGTYYYYYTKTFNEVDLRSCIAVRTSPDMKHWSGSKIVHIQNMRSNCGGNAESPFIVKRKNIYYLFVCRAGSGYNQTHVYWSKTPDHFPIENLVCELPTHASEVIEVSPNKWYISNTGWDKKGLYVAEMKWGE